MRDPEPSAHVVLVAGRPSDAPALTAACPGMSVVTAQPHLLVAALSGLRGRRIVLVALEPDAPVRELHGLLRTAGLRPPMVALADVEQREEVRRWLAGGGDDVVYRPHWATLEAVAVRLERDGAAQLERDARAGRLRAATSELLALAGGERFRGDELEGPLHAITEAGARGLGVDRCEVWLLDDVLGVVSLADRYDARLQVHASWPEPHRAEGAPDLEALSAARLVAVRLPLGPASPASLEVAIRLGGRTVGALRFEHGEGPRGWDSAEEAFAGALADLTALALESNRRGRAERALVSSERRFRDLFFHGSDAIVLYRVSLDGTVFFEDFNPAAERMTGLGRDEAIGRQGHEVLDPSHDADVRARFHAAISARTPVTHEHQATVDGSARWFNTALVPLLDESGAVQRLASISRDVTAARDNDALHRRLDAQLAELQKSEALGRLASHIAHDVNNMLTVIVAHAQRLTSLGGRPAEVAGAILEATARGRDLAQQVLTFGRRRPAERRPVDLGPVVQETVRLLEPTAPGVTMRVELPAAPVPVMADRSQMNQVLTNLCSNAVLAMPGGGTLTVRLELVDVDYQLALASPPLQEGRWVRLSVSDTGVGMDDAVRRRVFEPFFTTRGAGGTGLGLSVVSGIVHGHEGTVLVDSAPGRGTTFTVYLRPAQPLAERPGSGQHLMLVDDHPTMARVSARLLEALGYRTTVFDDPREALSAVGRAPGAFDAVLTDLSMPQMSGQDFTTALKGIAPGLPVIVSSGLASDIDQASLLALGVSAVLVKPWRLEEAMATIQRVLVAS